MVSRLSAFIHAITINFEKHYTGADCIDSVVVRASTRHAGGTGSITSIPGHDRHAIFGVKTWLSTVSLVNWIIVVLMLVPSLFGM